MALIFRLKQSRLGVKAIGLSDALIKWCASAKDAVYSDLAKCNFEKPVQKHGGQREEERRDAL